MLGKGQTMALDTFTLIASQYALEEDALADYDNVRSAYVDLGIIDTYDAAVITKRADGKVEIVRRVEEPTRQGAIGGLAVGLAVGALVALFPAVALGAGLAIGGASGAALGATAGHVAAGMSRSDLKDLGELLDSGTSGLIVIAATDVEARVESAIQRGKDIAKKQVQIGGRTQVRDRLALILSPVRCRGNRDDAGGWRWMTCGAIGSLRSKKTWRTCRRCWITPSKLSMPQTERSMPLGGRPTMCARPRRSPWSSPASSQRWS